MLTELRFTLTLANAEPRTKTVVLEPWTGEYALPADSTLDILVEGTPVGALRLELASDRITMHAFDSAGANLTAFRNGKELKSEHH